MGMQSQIPSEAARIAAAQAAQQAARQDPGTWARFLGPAMRGVTTGLEKLDAPFEFLKQQALAPVVEGLTQASPVRWQPGPGALNFDLNFDAWVTPEGKFSPGAALHNIATLVPPIAAIETKAMDPIFAAPGTRRYANIEKALYQKYQELGRPLSEMEVRQTGEELYKLPPFMRGTLEELPYFMIPPAGVARAASAATRAGKMLRPAGTRIAKGAEGAGQFQPTGTLARQAPGVATAARGALKVGEAALKPLDILERATMKAISVPAKGLIRGATATGGYFGRKTSEWTKLRDFGNRVQENIDEMITKGEDPTEALQSGNTDFANATGVSDRFIIQNNRAIQNPNVQLPSDTTIGARVGRDIREQTGVPRTKSVTETPADPPNSNIPSTLEAKNPPSPVANTVNKGLESGKWFNPIVMAKQTGSQMLDKYARLATELSGKVPYIQRLDTGRAADNYVAFMNKFHDGQFLLRNFQDNFWRSNKVNKDQIFQLEETLGPEAFKPGGRFDVVTKMRLAMGAKMKGLQFYANFTKNTLADAADKGVDRFDIDRFVFAKRANYLYTKHPAWTTGDPARRRGLIRFLDYETVPGTKKLVSEGGVVVDNQKIIDWTDLTPGSALHKKYGDNAVTWNAFKDAVYDTRDLMRMTRRRQFEARVLPRSMFAKYDLTDERIADIAANESDEVKKLWNEFFLLNNRERRLLIGENPDIERLAKVYNELHDAIDPWYMPMAYINAAEKSSGLLRPGYRGAPRLSHNAWDEFADLPASATNDIGYTAKPLTGEVMLRHLMADEVRAAENDLMNDLFDMGLFREHGLVNVSKLFAKTLVDESHVYDAISDAQQLGQTRLITIKQIREQLKLNDITGTEKEVNLTVKKMLADGVITKQPNRNQYAIADNAVRPETRGLTKEDAIPGYNPKTKSGVITFFRDGERVVLAANEQGGAVNPTLWNTIYGRGGLDVRGAGSRGWMKGTLAFSNGFFRGALTTYNPLFIVKNMVIDLFTGTMAGGLSIPHESLARLVRSARATAFDQEDRFLEIYMGGGGLQGRIFDPTPAQYRKISQAVDDARQDGVLVQGEKQLDKALKDAAKEMMGIENQTWGRKVVGGLKAWKSVPAVGALAEQSVRYAVAKRSFKRQLEMRLGKAGGKEEWNRLTKELNQRDWEYELFTNWKNTGRGLVDSAEAKAASVTGVQATLDFSRGGDMIRELNSYVLFLNATMEGLKFPFRAMGVRLLPKVRTKQYKINESTGIIEEGPFKGLTVQDERVPKYEFLERGEGLVKGGVTTKAFETGTGGVLGGRVPLVGADGPKSVALRVGAAVGAYTFIQEAWNKQWEYEGTPLYYDVPEYVRNNALVIMLPPPRDENGDYIMDVDTNRPKVRYLVVPHNLREWNLMFQPMNFMMDEMRNDVPRDMHAFFYDLYRNQSPVGDGIPIPELARYVTELGTGEDLFRGQPIVGNGLKNELPPEQYDTRSSEAVIRLAQSVYDSELPDWIKNRISSPKRAEHYFTGATGSLGQEGLTAADYLVDMLDNFRDAETRPMKERIAEYREMDKTSRAEFLTNLNFEDYKEFQKEIRRPAVEFPFFTTMKETYVRDRAGGLEQVARSRTEKAFPQISTEDTYEAGRIARQVNDTLRFRQQESDAELGKWNKDNTSSKVSPDKWIEARKGKKREQTGLLLAINEMFPSAVYNQPDEVRDEYYQSLYTAAGIDTRNGTELLIAAYYAIEPDGETPDAIDWTKFYQTRDEFMQKIRASSESAGDQVYNNFYRALQKKMTDMEKSYDNARRYLSTYWNLGSDVSQLTSNPSPALQQQWEQYNALPNNAQKESFREAYPHIDQLTSTRTTLRKMLIQQDLDRNGVANLDSILVYWYGGKNYHQGYTDEGKAYHQRLYGVTKSGFNLRNGMTGN